MKLVYSNNKTREVKIGDIVRDNDAGKFKLSGIEKPHKPGSTGRVYVRQINDESGVFANEMQFFPGVFGMEWIEREDQSQFIPDTVQAVVPNPDYKRKVKEKPQRTHNEWFRTVHLGGRKSCPECKAKLEPGESIWTWGEYHNAKWRNVMRFCKTCFINRVYIPLKEHSEGCGCNVQLVAYGGVPLPDWLSLK